MAHQFHLADLFETVAATVPDRIAIISDTLTLTYSELDDRASRVAAGLAAQGVTRGDTVGLYMMNRPEHVEAFLAIIKLGAIPFNVNYRYRAEELRYLFDNAKAAVIFFDAGFAATVDRLLPDLSDLKLAISVGGGSMGVSGDFVDYADLLAAEPSGPWERSENDILLTYTGGTTGMPKGVMWPHRAFFFSCAGAGGYFNPTGPANAPEEIADRAATGYPLRMFPIAPLMHAAALWAVWTAFLNGLTVVLDDAPRFDAIALWEKIAALRINLVQIVGDAMAMPMRDALKNNPGRWDLSSVMNLGSGGAVFSRHVKEELRGLLPASANITDGMGSSETGMSGLAQSSGEGLMRLPASADQRVVVNGCFAEVGEAGLVARSGNTPIGYFGDPDKTAEVFRMIDGRLWAISGDSARLDDDDMITVFGRGSTCINSGGEKIFPEEVEEALRSHPAIADAVVAGQADERWGERVVGIVSLRSGQERPDLADLRASLRDRLADYKQPKALVWVDEVKRSAAGKQDYRWAKAVAGKAV